MEKLFTIKSLREALIRHRGNGARIGFVPTMGALHEGHLSLLGKCVDENDISVVSIFVNPTQFNDPNDLRNYPRSFNKDCDLLEAAHCHYVFSPDVEEMYPTKDNRSFNFGDLDKIMEGSYRPGHFKGVAQIVTKLFDIVEPDQAYFGQKDFQQLAIIRKLVSDYNYPVKIIGCPIIRESDGLAMSSRNQLLSDEQRKASPLIFETLQKVKNQASDSSVPELESMVETSINANPFLKLDYFQLTETKSLNPIDKILPAMPVTACIAVFAGNVRLIDNIDIIS